MRAILLASAIATSIRGFLAIIRASHDPAGAPRLAATHHSHRADDKQPSQVSLPHPRDAPEPRFATRGVLSWGEAEPGREVASPCKGLGWRCQRLQRCCADRTDTRNAHETPRCLILSCAVANPPVECCDLLVERGNVSEQQRAELDNDARQVVVHVLHLSCKPSDVKYALRRNNPVLRQVTAQGIDRLRPLPDQEVPSFENHARGLL